MELVTAVLAFIVAIGVLVVVHEMGHYLVARAAGVRVLRFSIGFGRPLWRRIARNGTEWTVGWLPLGGYVKMLDEREFAVADPSSAPHGGAAPDPTSVPAPPPAARAADFGPDELRHAFNRQSVSKRMAIVAAGPVANFLLAIALFSVLYFHGFDEPQAIVGPPAAQTAAARAGLVDGERIIGLRVRSPADSADDADASDVKPIRSWPELREALQRLPAGTRAVTLLTQREGGRYDHELRLTPLAADAADASVSPASSPDTDRATALGLVPGGGAPLVAAVEPDSPAAQAGLKLGDEIRGADGQPVASASALVALTRMHPGQTMLLQLVRDGKPLSLPVTPAVVAGTRATGGAPIGRIGAALGTHLPTVRVDYDAWDAIRMGTRHTWNVASFSVAMFGRMLTGEASIKNLSGPVSIADYAGRSARMGLEAFLGFLALVSISLGVLNLLPIPVLDGGHLLYYAVEAATGRPLSDRMQSFMQRIGLVCIVALSVVALFNDLTRLVTG